MQQKYFISKFQNLKRYHKLNIRYVKALKQGKNLEYGSYFKEHSSNITLMRFSLILPCVFHPLPFCKFYLRLKCLPYHSDPTQPSESRANISVST